MKAANKQFAEIRKTMDMLQMEKDKGRQKRSSSSKYEKDNASIRAELMKKRR